MTIKKAVREFVSSTKKHSAKGFNYSIITNGKDYKVLEFYGNEDARLADGWSYVRIPDEIMFWITINTVNDTVAALLKALAKEGIK